MDIEYAYGQTKLTEITSRQFNLAVNGGNMNGHYRFKEKVYGLSDIPTSFRAKIDQTLNDETPLRLDDVLEVTREDKEKHRTKFFILLEKPQEAGCRPSQRKSQILQKETTWLGHAIIKKERNRIKKDKNYPQIKTSNSEKQLKLFLGALQ